MPDNFQKLGDVAAKVVDRITISCPKTREEWLAGRMTTIGASEVPALFGVSPYMTPFELYAIKHCDYVREFDGAKIKENSIHLPPTERGNLLEPVAIELTKRLRPTWTVEINSIPGGEVFVDQAARMSCTPDAFIIDPKRPGQAGALQIKSVAEQVFNSTWKREDGAIEPPVAVAVQAIVDATLSSCDFAYAGAIVVGWSTAFYLVEIPLHARLMVKARELVADFWRRIAVGEPYPADFARDGAAIAAIYGDDDGGEIDLSTNNRIVEVVGARELLKAREADGSAAAKERKTLDTEIIATLGNAARGRLADGRTIEAKTVRRGAYSVEPTSYRQVRIKDAGGKTKRAALAHAIDDPSKPF
jgi:hypothetical protein